MAPAPLPPHERQWRHPSELAPTTADIEVGSNGRGLVMATGAAAAMLATVMVIALTPPKSTAPSAVSATTVPAVASQQLQDPERGSVERAQSVVRLDRNTVTQDNILTLSGAPKSVSAAPETDGLNLAASLPAPDDRIVVLTRTRAYDLAWSEIDRVVAAPDGAVVITRSGEIVGVFADGALTVLVD